MAQPPAQHDDPNLEERWHRFHPPRGAVAPRHNHAAELLDVVYGRFLGPASRVDHVWSPRFVDWVTRRGTMCLRRESYYDSLSSRPHNERDLLRYRGVSAMACNNFTIVRHVMTREADNTIDNTPRTA